MFDQLMMLLYSVSLFFVSMYAHVVATPVEVPPLATTTATVVSVIDGDTIDVIVEGSTEQQRVRYIGIDTPEPYAEAVPECGSAAASTRNEELVSGQSITLVPGALPYDTYGRLLAYVYANNVFVNETLVTEGYATVMMIQPNTQYQTHFNNLYKTARTEKRGIWAACSDL
jgi:micrococcal nuclease